MKPWRRYFFPRPPLPGVPHQLIAPYDIRTANREQRLAIMAGKARSPQAADKLFDQYGVKTTQELLHKIPPPSRMTFKEKLVALIWRWAGHYRPRRYGRAAEAIRVEYHFKDTRPGG